VDAPDRIRGLAVERLVAPAKLTVTLEVLGRRHDGLHDLRAEMMSVDLADELTVDPGGDGLVVAVEPPAVAAPAADGENLVHRALAVVGRRAAVHLVKRIPVGGGLGGGSSDAAAILRWAGVTDPEVAAGLGADVPFCVVGGRAEVTGMGERVRPLLDEDRSFVLLVPPFGVDTGAVYRAWDALGVGGDRPEAPPGGGNDLTAAALVVEPRLARWRDRFAEVTGRVPALAGSGSTWFVDGVPEGLGLAGRHALHLGPDEARLLAVRTVPAGWAGTRPAEPTPTGGPDATAPTGP